MLPKRMASIIILVYIMNFIKNISNQVRLCLRKIFQRISNCLKCLGSDLYKRLTSGQFF